MIRTDKVKDTKGEQLKGSHEMTNTFGEYISVYTRAQAIEDGQLVDVSSVAKEAGIKFPVALTRSVFDAYVSVPPGVECQDEAGRLWDILWMLRLAGRRGGETIQYSLYVRNDNRRPRRVSLKAICGPGDTLDPVITVMLPNED